MNRTLFDDVLFINRDPCWSFTDAIGWDVSDKASAQASIECFWNRFTKHSITDMSICIYENTSIVPSKTVLWRGAKYLYTEENGSPVSYPNLRGLYKIYAEYDLDPVKTFLQTMKDNGIRPWLSLRMNDAHHGCEQTSFLRDNFFYEAQRNGMMLGEDFGYFAWCLDFRFEAVRNRLLAYIKEMLERYDPFGIELDFMREMHCFAYTKCPNRHEIMTDFMKSVKTIVSDAQSKRGHIIPISVRMPRSIQDAFVFGFDIAKWAKLGYIDAVVPSPRWTVTDSTIPIDEWRAALGDEIAIFPCIEINNVRKSMTDAETAKAYSAAWNTMGADGLYFYNHDYATEWHRRVYSLHKDSVLRGLRRFILTKQDFAALGTEPYRPLPFSVDGCGVLAFHAGPIRNCDKASLILEFDGTASPEVSANGVALGSGQKCASVIGRCPQGELELTGENTYCYSLPITTSGAIELALNGKGTVLYLEIRMEEKQ